MHHANRLIIGHADHSLDVVLYLYFVLLRKRSKQTPLVHACLSGVVYVSMFVFYDSRTDRVTAAAVYTYTVRRIGL